MRGNMIEMDRIIQGVDKVNKEKLFPLPKKTRSNCDP